MPRPHELIGIGEFARRVRLSVKQLRNYDELGLLAPAYVDSDSGYRYYHRGQARTAITIALLRSLDVPLADVHSLLVAEPSDVARVLDGQRARLADDVERKLHALRSLDRLLSGDDLLPYEVGERDEPAVALTGLRVSCSADRLEQEAPAAISALDDILSGGVPDAQPVIGLYPLDLEGEIEFFVGIGSDVEAATPAGAVTVSLEPARVVATTHIGRYDELQLAYFPLLAHAEERGLDPGTRVREVYVETPPAVAPERARTEVLLPVGGSAA